MDRLTQNIIDQVKEGQLKLGYVKETVRLYYPLTDFDYVLYYCNREIDEYYYCVKMEMGHTIYHRFTKEDYELL